MRRDGCILALVGADVARFGNRGGQIENLVQTVLSKTVPHRLSRCQRYFGLHVTVTITRNQLRSVSFGSTIAFTDEIHLMLLASGDGQDHIIGNFVCVQLSGKTGTTAKYKEGM